MQSAEPTSVRGFVVHSTAMPGHARSPGRAEARLALLGRTDDGRTFAVLLDPYHPFFYVRESDRETVTTAGAASMLAGGPGPTGRSTIDGEAVLRLEFASPADLRRAEAHLRAGGVRTYEADLNPTDPFMIDRHIHGSLRIKGQAGPGRHVDLVFINPEIESDEWDPVLEVLSLDIETDPRTDEVLAVALVCAGAWSEPVSEVHFLFRDRQPQAPPPWMRVHDDEASLLEAVVSRIVGIDPDIITGWNVIDFDFAVISRRLARHRLRFAISRSDEPARFLESTADGEGRRQNAAVSCPGRQIIDGLRLVRYGPQRFTDRKLGSVAQEVLGETKTVEAETSTEKIGALLALYRDDPTAFCDYCRTDAELVLRILEKTGLLALTLARCRLTGVSLNRAWTSIPAFEFLYLEAMHDRNLVAPTLGVDRLPQGDVAGGAILKPHPGLFTNVLVFDFKSLYPSIISTFGIDPVGYLDTEEGYPEGTLPPPPEPDSITAPNGARFAREGSLLPAILASFWGSRDAARRRGDQVAAYVYKIIMNSFYGVLGTPGCRFAGAPLAGAITGFGQYLLHWTRARFTERGMKVLYGDTDSLFVLASPDSDVAELFVTGERLREQINADLASFLATAYLVSSKLELEFERVYSRFYLPRVRHAAGDGPAGEVRGRAKGYAGLPVDASGETGPIEIKGMEAIRSDWTRAASDLQRELLELLFAGADASHVAAHVRHTIEELRAGTVDEKLVYSRRLRKSVSAYTSSRPPHVQAAAMLPPQEREGVIDYLVTTEGPQPPSRRTAPIDHAHYLDRQIRPIAEPICEVLGMRADELFDPSHQLSLFEEGQ